MDKVVSALANVMKERLLLRNILNNSKVQNRIVVENDVKDFDSQQEWIEV